MKALDIQCLSNLKQLQLGWQMYVDDHSDGLPGNEGRITHLTPGKSVRADLFMGTNSWVEGNCYMSADPGLLQNGVLFRYVNALGVYRCPADRSTVQDQGKVTAQSQLFNERLHEYGAQSEDGNRLRPDRRLVR